jgi:hypothetical protein
MVEALEHITFADDALPAEPVPAERRRSEACERPAGCVPAYPEKLAHLQEIGFDEELARSALEAVEGDIGAAATRLISS